MTTCFRLPFSYQYSALSQFDTDPDDDLADLTNDNDVDLVISHDSSDEENIASVRGRNHLLVTFSCIRLNLTWLVYLVQ